METSSKFHRVSLKLAKNLTYLKFWILDSVLNARNLDSLLCSLFCLPIVTRYYVVIVRVYLQREGKRII